jgi:alpha-amylase
MFTAFSFLLSNANENPVDGLRLDSALNVDLGFFTAFSKAAGIFSTGEVLSGVNSDVCPYQAVIGSVLNYPTWVEKYSLTWS